MAAFTVGAVRGGIKEYQRQKMNSAQDILFQAYEQGKKEIDDEVKSEIKKGLSRLDKRAKFAIAVSAFNGGALAAGSYAAGVIGADYLTTYITDHPELIGQTVSGVKSMIENQHIDLSNIQEGINNGFKGIIASWHSLTTPSNLDLNEAAPLPISEDQNFLPQSENPPIPINPPTEEQPDTDPQDINIPPAQTIPNTLPDPLEEHKIMLEQAPNSTKEVVANGFTEKLSLIPKEIALPQNSSPWEQVSLISQQLGIELTPEEHLEATRKIAEESGIKVSEWGLSEGKVDHTNIPVGFKLVTIKATKYIIQLHNQ